MRKLLLSVIVCLASTFAGAQDLLVAAASDLNFVLPEIASRFQQKTGKKVAFTFGSSGNFYQQISNGAPFDVFFSADEQYPASLQKEGLTEPGTLHPYAIGKLVLFVPGDSKLEVTQGLKVLLQPGVRKIAIANPQHAPYGRAAVEAFRKEGLYDKLKDKLVLGENISQAAQFIQSGNADAGVIALSLASAPAMRGKGRFIEVPTSDYSPIRQAAVVLKTSKRTELARQFLQFMQQPEIVSLMKQYGFSSPAAP